MLIANQRLAIMTASPPSLLSSILMFLPVTQLIQVISAL